MRLKQGVGRTVKSDESIRIFFNDRCTLHSVIATSSTDQSRINIESEDLDLEIPSPSDLNTITGGATNIEDLEIQNIKYNTSEDTYTQMVRLVDSVKGVEVSIHNPAEDDCTVDYLVTYDA